MSIIKFILTSIFFIGFSLQPAQTYAISKTYYVTQNGMGARTGEPGNAWSVSDFNALSGTGYAGDTIYFSGEFTTRIVVTNMEGTPGHPVILDGNQSGDCDPINSICSSSALLLDGMSIGNSKSGPDYLNIQDFRMTRQTGTNPCFQISASQSGNDDQKHVDYLNINRNYVFETNGTMFSYYGGRYSTVQNNKFTHYGQNGTDAVQGVNLVEVDDFILKENEIGHSEYNYPSGCTSSELIELHGCKKVLIEANNIYGAPNQSGIRPKEWSNTNMEDIVIRYNKIHDNNNNISGKGIAARTSGGTQTISNMYIYANMIYSNYTGGILIGRGVDNVHIWSNILVSDGRYGFATWDDPPSSNIFIFNNTIARNGTNGDADKKNRGGIVIGVANSNVNIMNNIFWNNRSGGEGAKFNQIYSVISLSSLEVDTYYHSLSAPTFYYDGYFRSLSTMQNIYSKEDDTPTGEIADPGLLDPDGPDNSYGTADDDYRLDGTYINNGADLSQCFDVSIQGMIYHLCYNDALDPDATNWETNPPTVRTAKQGDHGTWERGAYVYKEKANVPPPSPYGLRITN